MSKTCTRCGGVIFAAEKPVIVPGCCFHDACFKCRVCGTKLTLKTQHTLEGDVYCKHHKPGDVPSQVADSKMAHAMAAQALNPNHGTLEFQKSSAEHEYGSGAVAVDHAMKAQALNPNHGTVEFQKSSAEHEYGSGAVAVDHAMNAPKPPTTVGNVNNMEVRHQGTAKFTSS